MIAYLEVKNLSGKMGMVESEEVRDGITKTRFSFRPGPSAIVSQAPIQTPMGLHSLVIAPRYLYS